MWPRYTKTNCTIARRSGRNALLQRFGVLFGYKFVVLYVEPTPGKGASLTTNTARTTLLLDGEKLPWDDWAYEFRENMPKQLAASSTRNLRR